MGHVPRTSGATGTYREQELNRAIADRLAPRLETLGHTVYVMGADDPMPITDGDVFIALHGDSPSTPGACVGYPDDPIDADDKALATAWKAAHTARGYPGPYRADNYTPALSNYYMWEPETSSFYWRFLAEHGSMHSSDEVWLFAHLDDVAEAHVDAIGQVVGHPAGDDDLPFTEIQLRGMIRSEVEKLLNDISRHISGIAAPEWENVIRMTYEGARDATASKVDLAAIKAVVDALALVIGVDPEGLAKAVVDELSKRTEPQP